MQRRPALHAALNACRSRIEHAGERRVVERIGAPLCLGGGGLRELPPFWPWTLARAQLAGGEVTDAPGDAEAGGERQVAVPAEIRVAPARVRDVPGAPEQRPHGLMKEPSVVLPRLRHGGGEPGDRIGVEWLVAGEQAPVPVQVSGMLAHRGRPEAVPLAGRPRPKRRELVTVLLVPRGDGTHQLGPESRKPVGGYGEGYFVRVVGLQQRVAGQAPEHDG